MRRSFLRPRQARKPVRASFRPFLERLEDRLAPDVSLPSGFANITIVNSGLTSPATLETLPDGRVLVGLQNGTIRVVQNDALLTQPLINLSNVDSGGERGLLGLTYDPNFATNRQIYVYYTVNALANPALPFSHNRLSRLTLTGSTAGNEQVLWELPNLGTAIWHMGGAVHFGPDNMIYVSVGDHQNPPTAQSLNSQFGKILRLNVSGATATIPVDNPFYNTATGDNRAIWAMGLRNPYTTAFQPGTGRFYINDVGEGSWEEVNQGAPGRNFGWPNTEGPFNPSEFPNFTNPLFAYPHSGPPATSGCAVTGGDFYNPQVTVFPSQFVGKYFVQDFCSGWIKTIDPVTSAVSDFATGLSFPTDMRVSRDGAIYYITRGQQTGGQPATGGVGKIVFPANQLPLITSHPTNQMVAVGEPATFRVTVSSLTPITYQWQRNGINIPGATADSYTIATTSLADHDARFRVVVTNTAGSVTSNEGVLTVINSQRPTAVITTPAAGTTYRGGDIINFAGTGSDPEDGALSGSAFTWQVEFHHDDHTHPHLAPTSGITSGTFVAPTNTHPEGTLFFRVFLTVRDSAGLTHTTFRDIAPQRSQVTLNTNIPGLQLRVEGQPRPLPHTVNAVVNTDLRVEAPPVQAVGDNTYEFVSWSDGGAATHTLRVPPTSTTLIATYRTASVTYISDLTPSLPPINGWGPIEFDMSNGEQAARDGRPITLNGVVYRKGLGVHAVSEVTYNLAGIFTWFLSDVGVDDETGVNGSVVFQVWADGVQLYDSGLMTGSTATRTAFVNVTGRNQLKLIVTGGGDSIDFDHADWANAQLIGIPRSTNLQARGVSATQIDLTWVNSGDVTEVQVERSADGGPFEQIAVVGAGQTSYSDAGIAPGAYTYRVRGTSPAGVPPYSNTVSVTLGTTTIDQSSGFTRPDLFTLNGAAALLPNVEPVGIFAGHQDIGAVAARGSATFANGTYTLRGSGADIWGTVDAFHYVYQPLVGDGEIIARVTSVGNTDFWAKAGVMIRESLAPNSRHAMMITTPVGHDEASFQRRIQTGGDSTASDAGIGSGPTQPSGYWVRLVRSGNSFTAFRSANGTDWIPVGGAITINMTEVVFVGLVATAHNNSGVLSTSTIDNVQITGGTTSLQPLLRLTDGTATFQPGSLFTSTQVGVSHFRTEFTFQVTGPDNPVVDGLTFTIQGNNPRQLGATGGELGYTGIRNSVAVKFDTWDNAGEGIISTGLFSDGRSPTFPAAGSGDVNVNLVGSGIDLRSRRPFHVTMLYDGTALNVTIRDTITGAIARQSYTVDIPAIIGSTTGYVGFTAATGGLRAIHDVQSFTFQALPTTLLHADPGNLEQTALVVFGTPDSDTISFEAEGPDSIRVVLNGTPVGVFTPTARIIAYGLGGNDAIAVSDDISLPAWLFGGPGDDVLTAGVNDDVLVGGDGDDVMYGGSSGRDVMVGGSGRDQIVGGSNDDLLVAGTTAFDGNHAALAAVMAEWASNRDYAMRVDNLRGTGSGPRLNGNFFLRVDGPARTVFDDGTSDVLVGTDGRDWFFADVDGSEPDLISDRSGDELFDELD